MQALAQYRNHLRKHPQLTQLFVELTDTCTTNGVLISGETGLEMKKLGLQSITISLDWLEEMHDWFRNQKGCFQKTVRSISELCAAGRPKAPLIPPV